MEEACQNPSTSILSARGILALTDKRLLPRSAHVFCCQYPEAEAKKWLEAQLGSMLDNTRGSIERWVDSLTGVDQNPVAAIRLATEQLETALNRLQLAPIADA
jgi:hypothetical protein